MVKKMLKGTGLVVLLLFALAFLKFSLLGKALKKEDIASYITASENKNNIRLTFLGCAGFIIEHHQKSILCDPFFSNPGLLEFGKTSVPWTQYVDKEKLASIDLVTISHGHYDHCYDIEDLCKHIQPDTKIIGDISVQNQLHAIYDNPSYQDVALHYREKQDWIYNNDSTFRIFPLQSIHSPHIGNIELLKGKYTEPLAEIPQWAWQWKKGEAYSYLIDLMLADSVAYRIILVNGNLSTPAITALQQLSAQRKSDVQLQIFWKEKMVKENLEMVYKITRPEQVILHHWNNFFKSNDAPLEYFRDSNLPDVLKTYNDNNMHVSVMLPFTTVNL